MSAERWLTKKEAADLAQLHEQTIYRAIRKGALKKAKNGVRRVRIAESDLLRWMNGAKLSGA